MKELRIPFTRSGLVSLLRDYRSTTDNLLAALRFDSRPRTIEEIDEALRSSRAAEASFEIVINLLHPEDPGSFLTQRRRPRVTKSE